MPNSMPDRSSIVKPYFHKPEDLIFSAPWRNQMTCCIAASCSDGPKSRIVLCCEYRVETDIAGAETEFKLRWAMHNWPTLFAGGLSSTEDLINTFQKHLNPKGFLTIDNYLDEFRIPPRIQKRKLAEAHIGTRLGMSYKAFISEGKEKLPQVLFEELFGEIKRIELGCCLLITGFISGDPIILTMQPDGGIYSESAFGAVGTGGTIASSALYQRQYHGGFPLPVALYCVYEAMKLAQIAPGVGRRYLFLAVCEEPKSEKDNVVIRTVNSKGKKFLEAQYKKFGPKYVPNFAMPRDYVRKSDVGDLG